MAAIEYVDTTIGTGNDDGTTWANAWRNAVTALGSALASVDAGGTIYIQSDSAHQYSADTTFTCANATSVNPVTIISVKNTNEPPTAGDYESMMTNGTGVIDAKTNGGYNLNFFCNCVWVGLKFMAGNNISIGDNDQENCFIDCLIRVDDQLGLCVAALSDASVRFENVDVEQVTPGGIAVSGAFVWEGGSYSVDGGSFTTNIFVCNASRGGYLYVFCVDLRDGDAGDYLVNDVNASWDVLFKRCKIPSAVNYMNNGPTGKACKVRFHSVDDGNFIYRFNEYYFEGQILEDVAVFRDAAATYDGTNEYSVKIISNANAKEWARPLRFKLADIWCAANPTLTVELNTDNVVLQNDEFWLEIEYPDGTTGALGLIDRTSRPPTILTAPANLTTSAAAWTEGFGTEKPQKISEVIASGQAGIHTIWACLAKPSTTVYVCPKVDVS